MPDRALTIEEILADDDATRIGLEFRLDISFSFLRPGFSVFTSDGFGIWW